MTNLDLVEFCKKALKLPTVYMWGTYGKPITKDLCNSKFEQYPSRYSKMRRTYLLSLAINKGDTRGCDCVGLIKWAMWTNGDITKSPKYSSKTDRNCSGFYNAANVKGPVAVMPEIPGLIVYKKGHVGVYMGNGEVVECTLGSRGDGVVKTKLLDVAWTHWLELPEMQYILPNAGTPLKKKASFLEKLNLIKRRIQND